jgi:hypothetical protein
MNIVTTLVVVVVVVVVVVISMGVMLSKPVIDYIRLGLVIYLLRSNVSKPYTTINGLSYILIHIINSNNI